MTSSSADIDSLFQLPLAEFTAARNALAARLKKAGKGDEAQKVKALAKPSVSAWVVNQLYWNERAAFDRLMETGAAFRQAQSAQMAGKPADLRRAIEERRSALADLARAASKLMTEAGHQPSPETMRRITTTLEALSTYGNAPGAPPAGRLTDDVDPPGFETLAALIPTGGGGAKTPRREPSLVIPFAQKARRRRPVRAGSRDPRELEEERKAQRAAAQAAVKAAERTLRDARTAAERAEAALKRAAERVKAAEQARSDAEARLEKAIAELVQLKQEARKVASEAEEAAQAVTEAERALERSQAQLEELADVKV